MKKKWIVGVAAVITIAVIAGCGFLVLSKMDILDGMPKVNTEYDYDGWKTKPDSYDYKIADYLTEKQKCTELYLTWSEDMYNEASETIELRVTQESIIQDFLEQLEEVSIAKPVEKSLPQYNTTEEEIAAIGEYAAEPNEYFDVICEDVQAETALLSIGSSGIEGTYGFGYAVEDEDEYEHYGGYVQSEENISELVHQFILKYRKELSMDDVISMFGNEELVWYDFELYNMTNHDTVDLGNGWTLQVNDYKKAGEEYVYDGSKKPDSIILSNGSVSMDIRKDTIQAFWDLHGN